MSDLVERLGMLIAGPNPALTKDERAMVGEAADELTRLRSEVERLTRERDEAHMFVEVTSEKLSEAVEDRAQATVRAQAAEAELTTLEAENKALREALERVRSTLATADESGLLRDVIWMVGSPNETLFDFLAALTPATGA